MGGMYEKWLDTLVSALQQREKEANVVVVNWLALAQQLYTIAVNNTRVVGKQLAELLDWLEVNFTSKQNISLCKPHTKMTARPRIKLMLGSVTFAHTRLTPWSSMTKLAECQKKVRRGNNWG